MELSSSSNSDSVQEVGRAVRNCSHSELSPTDVICDACFVGDLDAIQALLPDWDTYDRLFPVNDYSYGVPGWYERAGLHEIAGWRDDGKGWTLLHCACSRNRVDVARHLVEVVGLDIEAWDMMYSLTPLQLALRDGALDAVEYLRSQGADIYAKAMFGRTVLHIACDFENVGRSTALKTVQYLLETTDARPDGLLDIDAATDEGLTAFHYAVYNRHLPIAETLVKHGANGRATNKRNGDTALHVACKLSAYFLVKESLLQYLIDELKLDVNQPNASGKTALYYACAHGQLDLVHCLIERGARPDASMLLLPGPMESLPLVRPCATPGE